MQLSRRDALAALAAAGAVGSSALLAGRSPPAAGGEDAVEDDPGVDEAVVDALTAAAEVLYPTAVEGHREFVQTYALGRVENETYREGLARAVADLDDTARDWYGEAYAGLDADERDELLTQLGVATADPDPEGPIFARLRYYVVDELLFALYASPTGGRLVGIENPVGYPGGLESYRRARMPPERDDGGDADADAADADAADLVDPSDVWVGADEEGESEGAGTEGSE